MPSYSAILNVLPCAVGLILLLRTYFAIATLVDNDSSVVVTIIDWLGVFFFLWIGIGFTIAGNCLMFDLPELFLKQRDGTQNPAVWFHLGGWLIFYRGLWFLRDYVRETYGLCAKEGERPYDVIAPRYEAY